MVLAAGMGTRMRPLTDTMPKPLVRVNGKPLLDHVLDRLAAEGVERAVVNVHHFAEQIIAQVADRHKPQIVISDERGVLLDTGGGVVKALPELGDAPFYHLNADTIWIDGVQRNLARLAATFDTASMDALLLLAPVAGSIGRVASPRSTVMGVRSGRRAATRLALRLAIRHSGGDSSIPTMERKANSVAIASTRPLPHPRSMKAAASSSGGNTFKAWRTILGCEPA